MATPASGTSRARLVRGGDTFHVDGHEFRLDIEHDPCMGEPWKEIDCHGVVSDWTRRKKHPYERVLAEDRGSYRYYDVQESTKRALKDWVGPEAINKDGTRRERAAKMVEADFQRLRGWCNDQWSWVWLKVTILDGPDDGEFESLGGVESDGEEYISECAFELAHGLLSRLETTPTTRLVKALRQFPEHLTDAEDLNTRTGLVETTITVLNRIKAESDG